MARRPGRDGLRRKHVILNLTEPEFARLDRRAEEAFRPTAEYARMMILAVIDATEREEGKRTGERQERLTVPPDAG